jgi:hypothetical protein
MNHFSLNVRAGQFNFMTVIKLAVLSVTICIEAFLQDFLNGVFCSFECVLLPRLAVVRPQDHDLALLAAEGGEVGNLDDDGSENDDGAYFCRQSVKVFRY